MYKPLPEIKVLLVVLFHLCERGSRLVVKRRIFLCFLVEFYIYFGQRVYAAALYLLFAAPLLVSNNELSELRSPVAEMVYSDAVISAELVDILY